VLSVVTNLGGDQPRFELVISRTVFLDDLFPFIWSFAEAPGDYVYSKSVLVPVIREKNWDHGNWDRRSLRMSINRSVECQNMKPQTSPWIV